MKQKPPKILFYDIETTYLMARIWRLGEQRVTYKQLVDKYAVYDIICIAYCWNDGQPAKSLDWGRTAQDSSKMIERFDKLVQKADVVIGKNSDRFDNKHVNLQRMLHRLEAMPEWIQWTDDLEKQFRKHFYLPSQGLDYILKHILKRPGKIPMQMQDWINVVEGRCPKALKMMKEYCINDAEETRLLWNYAESYLTPKHNAATVKSGEACTTCGSTDLSYTYKRTRGKTMFQYYYCNSHAGYAGKAPINRHGQTGKMGK
jgi:hypothetical protein